MVGGTDVGSSIVDGFEVAGSVAVSRTADVVSGGAVVHWLITPYSHTATKYTKEHELVKFDETSGVGTVHITDYAQNSLGDVVFVELPTVGTDLEQHGENIYSGALCAALSETTC